MSKVMTSAVRLTRPFIGRIIRHKSSAPKEYEETKKLSDYVIFYGAIASMTGFLVTPIYSYWVGNGFIAWPFYRVYGQYLYRKKIHNQLDEEAKNYKKKS